MEAILRSARKLKRTRSFSPQRMSFQECIDKYGLQGCGQLEMIPKRIESSINPFRPKKYPSYDIVVLGSKGVGKSSIVSQYLDDVLPDTYHPTVCDLYERKVKVRGGDKKFAIRVHDTAGDLQFEFPGMYPVKIIEADMFLLVYSVDNYKSFRVLEETWKDIRKKRSLLKGTCVPTALLANKTDLHHKVSREEGRELARWIGCPFYEVSAWRSGSSLKEPINNLLREKRMQEASSCLRRS